MNNHDINKTYVSPYDRFLFEFDASHALTASQEKEIQKHQRIAVLRDIANPSAEQDGLWKEF